MHCDKKPLPVLTYVNLSLQISAKGKGQYSRDKYLGNPWDSGWIRYDNLHDVRTNAATVSVLCEGTWGGGGHMLASICCI